MPLPNFKLAFTLIIIHNFCPPGTKICNACKNVNPLRASSCLSCKQPLYNKRPIASTSHRSKYKTFKDPWTELQEKVILQHYVKSCIVNFCSIHCFTHYLAM